MDDSRSQKRHDMRFDKAKTASSSVVLSTFKKNSEMLKSGLNHSDAYQPICLYIAATCNMQHATCNCDLPSTASQKLF